eukprot:scaffold141_cov123-Isochrysis_galbana.AAC.9
MDFVHYFSPFDRVGGKGRVNPKLLLGLEVLPPSLTFQPLGTPTQREDGGPEREAFIPTLTTT